MGRDLPEVGGRRPFTGRCSACGTRSSSHPPVAVQRTCQHECDDYRGSRPAVLVRTGDGVVRRRAAEPQTGAGRSEVPISQASMPRAALRPSAMAQTMSDWPRLHVAGGEHGRHAGHPVLVAPDVAAVGQPDPELGEQAGPFRSQEAHREQDQIDVHLELAAGDPVEGRPAVLAAHFDLDAVQSGDTAVAGAREALGRHGVHAVAALLVRRRHAEDVGPGGPRVVRVPLLRRLGQQLELRHGGPLPAGARCRGQSAPVSPPPMMTTRLSFASIASAAGTASPSLRRFCCVR